MLARLNSNQQKSKCIRILWNRVEKISYKFCFYIPLLLYCDAICCYFNCPSHQMMVMADCLFFCSSILFLHKHKIIHIWISTSRAFSVFADFNTFILRFYLCSIERVAFCLHTSTERLLRCLIVFLLNIIRKGAKKLRFVFLLESWQNGMSDSCSKRERDRDSKAKNSKWSSQTVGEITRVGLITTQLLLAYGCCCF